MEILEILNKINIGLNFYIMANLIIYLMNMKNYKYNFLRLYMI